MKLKFYINEKEEKIYTLKKEINKEPTQDAHYKFLNLGDENKDK